MAKESVKGEYKCLFCRQPIAVMQGSQLDPRDGITVRCDNLSCTMSGEGHGKDEKAAFEVFNNKCVFGKVK